MAGRPPTPTNLKVLHGNPGKRALPKAEPKPRPITPECPSFLNAAACDIWRGLVDELDVMGVLTLVDESTFAAYCSAYEEAQRLDLFLNENGLTHTADSGYIQQRPEVAIRNKAWDRVAKFGSELGIGAASRTRIQVKKADDQGEDPVAKAIAVAAQRS